MNSVFASLRNKFRIDLNSRYTINICGCVNQQMNKLANCGKCRFSKWLSGSCTLTGADKLSLWVVRLFFVILGD